MAQLGETGDGFSQSTYTTFGVMVTMGSASKLRLYVAVDPDIRCRNDPVATQVSGSPSSGVTRRSGGFFDPAPRLDLGNTLHRRPFDSLVSWHLSLGVEWAPDSFGEATPVVRPTYEVPPDGACSTRRLDVEWARPEGAGAGYGPSAEVPLSYRLLKSVRRPNVE